MTRFQFIFTGILVALGITGVILFALVKNQAGSAATPITLWGTLKAESFNRFLSDVIADNSDTINITYVEKNAATFESDLIAALARGAGPDLILLPQDLMVQQFDKFYPVPYENFSARLFKDSFIQEGELFLDSSGITAFPFSIDPIVMYWNRDIFTNAGLSQPPKSWVDFFTLAPQLVKKDANGNITQAMIAFGETRNVTHAKEMISLLSLQAGTPIVVRDGRGGFASVFDSPSTTGGTPGEQAVSYFVEFSNPGKATYSWNRSLPNDKNAFTAGRLAVYFGYASELTSLRAANPNLNFDVAQVPQAGANKATFGAMNGLAILKASKNVPAAYAAATKLTEAPVQAKWVQYSGFPPIRRDMLASAPAGDAFTSVFYSSALISSAWLDPNRQKTVDSFARLIDGVTSGRLRVSEAVHQTSLEITNFLNSGK